MRTGLLGALWSTRNVIQVTPQPQERKTRVPKSRAGSREIDMTPLVRKVFQATDHEGLIFSPDGTQPLNERRWVKRQWKKAQVAAGIARPIRWHDLRHQCASLLVAAGKDPLYIAKQMGHAEPGLTLRQYGHLFETTKRTPVERIDDLVCPTGCDVDVTWTAATTRQNAGEQVRTRTQKTNE